MAHGITDDAAAKAPRTKVLTKNQKKKLQEEERKRALEMEKEKEEAAAQAEAQLAEETAKMEISKKEAKKVKN